MPSPTPYAQYVGDRDAVDVLRTSFDEYRALIPRIARTDWARPWAPGKWTIAQLILHVTQWEMIFGYRLRCGVSVPNFVVQPLDQDPFMDAESKAVDGPMAAATFEAVRRMNLAFAESLSPDARHRHVTHPERGQIDVNDLLVTLAGHAVHHLKQLQQVLDGRT
jgi:hypothetical protein